MTYHYRSHKSERVERETVAVYTFIGRMVQHVFPKSFQRLRYYGVQATRTFATIKDMIHEVLAKGKHVIKGAIKIMAALTYRQRYQRSTGRAPYAVHTVTATWGSGASGTRPMGSSMMSSKQ